MTDRHRTDMLSGLLSGEATRDEALDAASHLRTCLDCRQELAAAAVAHAALNSARHFAADLFPQPAPRAAATSAAEPVDTTHPNDQLEMGALPAQATEEHATRALRGSVMRRRLGVAVAAAVLAGSGVVVTSSVLGGRSTHQEAHVVTLTSIGAAHDSAHASIDGGRMRIDASTLPTLGPRHEYEVWLVSSSGQQLRPVGYIGDDRKADLPVPSTVLAQYAVVAISVQNAHEIEFSGDVVVSGTYA